MPSVEGVDDNVPPKGYGVYGRTGNRTGVFGESSSGTGVHGEGASGVIGKSEHGIGVSGRSNDRYITFKALPVEPDYMRGPNHTESFYSI